MVTGRFFDPLKSYSCPTGENFSRSEKFLRCLVNAVLIFQGKCVKKVKKYTACYVARREGGFELLDLIYFRVVVMYFRAVVP